MPLPIYDIQPELLSSLGASSRVVLSAPTGSGKSTQIPQMLLDAGAVGGQIIVMQPRRIAARMLAMRVARERNGQPGDEIGYHIRLERQAGPSTRILYVTEGILLREFLHNPNLDGIGCVIFDEFHERHLYGDVTLARSRLLQSEGRADLKLIVMSATLNTGTLETALKPCTTIESEGRTFPVDIVYTDKRIHFDRTPIWSAAADACERAMEENQAGDILVFMPGTHEIRRTVDSLKRSKRIRGMEVLPLHGELSAKDQDHAVSPGGRRRIIVATNIAETSITIDGVRVVVDSGLARIASHDANRGVNMLSARSISRASADQRAGRAGRVGPGTCFRLWTEREHSERPLQELPEIERLDLSEAVLALVAGGVGDLSRFPWLTPPPDRALAHAISLLEDLGAIKSGSGLSVTDMGRRMVAFPVHPRYARLLLESGVRNCVYEATLVAALMQGRSILIHSAGKEVQHRRADAFGDEDQSDFFVHFSALALARRSRFQLDACRELGIHGQAARQVQPLHESFLRIARAQGLPVNQHVPAEREAVQQCILAGFVDQLARRKDSGSLRVELIRNRRGEIDRGSVAGKARLVVAGEIREVELRKNERRITLSLCTSIREEWLHEQFPRDFSYEDTVTFDASGKRVVGLSRRKFRDLVLDEKPSSNVPAEQAASMLADGVLDGRFHLKHWDHEVEQWIFRVNALSRWCPELESPEFTADDRRFILEQVCLGCVSAKEVQGRPVKPILRDWLSPAHATALDEYAPDRVRLPSGRRIRVIYAENDAPTISVRIQDLFGVNCPLTIAMNRQRLRIQILAPNQRPVQVTDDPIGFWRDTYPAVKKQLQKKYPKHEWR